MAGHSKWANIKYRKERADKKRGKLFSRIVKEVISAVRQGGSDPKTNQKLRLAMQRAKEANVPGDNVERNIKKAALADQGDFTEVTYELYGFEGVGILVEGMTDNKNRIASEIRIAINKCGGTIATPGAVAYNFARKGEIRVAKKGHKEETLFLLVTDAGADDFSVEEEDFLITTSLGAFEVVKEAVVSHGVTIREAALVMVPKVRTAVSEEGFHQNMALIEWLEGLDDVDAVYTTLAIDS